MSIGCVACGVSTTTSEDMELHIRKAHDMWKCVHCETQFPTVETYVAHLEELAPKPGQLHGCGVLVCPPPDTFPRADGENFCCRHGAMWIWRRDKLFADAGRWERLRGPRMDVQKALAIVDSAQKCTGEDRCGCKAELEKHGAEAAKVLAAEVLAITRKGEQLAGAYGNALLLRTEMLSLLERYGGTGEAHHLRWVVDQLVRKLMDERWNTGETYAAWVARYRNTEGPDSYIWDEGIAP